MGNKEINDLLKQKKVGGFFDLPTEELCLDTSHDPPKFLYIPPGKGYKYVCPSCGKVTILKKPNIRF